MSAKLFSPCDQSLFLIFDDPFTVSRPSVPSALLPLRMRSSSRRDAFLAAAMATDRSSG